MSERVKLADAEVLSALASTDYLLAERNGAIGRAALGDNTFLTEAQRLWLEYYPKASGANLLPNDISGSWTSMNWSLEESLLDGVAGASIDPSTVGEMTNITKSVADAILPATWYTFTAWHKGGPWTLLVSNTGDVGATAYENGEAVTIVNAALSRTVPAAAAWTKYTFTYKTVAEFTADPVVYIRKQSTQADVTYVCMPKFERGPVATPWAG